MATKAQTKCIWALSKEMGKDVKYKEILDMPVEEASKIIETMKKEQETYKAAPATEHVEKVAPVTVGMIYKMVYQKFLAYKWDMADTALWNKQVIQAKKRLAQTEVALNESSYFKAARV